MWKSTALGGFPNIFLLGETAMKRKIVVSGSTVTAGQLKDLFRMIDDGTVGHEEMGHFLVNPKKFSSGGVSLVRAVNILGNRKVLTAEQAAKARNQKAPENASIRYSEAVLRECAEQNRTAGTDWRLVYVFGLSLREQRKQVGTGLNGFYNTDWWLEKKEDGWSTEEPHASYYLIDFNGRWGMTNWANQEAEIQKLGLNFERAHEAVVSEAILSIFQNTGERLLENWYHWGRSLTSYGYRVYVGCFGRDGLRVLGFCGPGWVGDDCLRVCLVRKFQS